MKDRPKKPICSVTGCANKRRYSSGLCVRHDKQIRRTGRILSRTTRDPNEIIIKKDYAEIILRENGNGKEIARAKIDLRDVKIARKYKWHLSMYGYASSNECGFLHHLIFGKPPVGLVTDHKKIGKQGALDNRRSNLHFVTQQQNTWKQKLNKRNKSGFKGVYFAKEERVFVAQITKNYKAIVIGRFENPKDAALAYDKMAIDKFGDFATTNKKLELL